MRCFTEHSETHNKKFKHRRGKMNATLDEVGTFIDFIKIRLYIFIRLLLERNKRN